MRKEELANTLTKYFCFQRASTKADKERIYKLRHKVYCQEFKYEEGCPSGQETDACDESAIHCALVHRQTSMVAGCVRLIEPSTNIRLLPLESFCGASLNHTTLHPEKLARSEICEISRLAVSAQFRPRSQRQPSENPDEFGMIAEMQRPQAERRVFPLISIAMFLAATALVGQTGRKHVFAMMEPRLARLLARSGLHFTQVGKMVDYHGPRAAFYINQHIAEQTMHTTLKGLYARVCEELNTATA